MKNSNKMLGLTGMLISSLVIAEPVFNETSSRECYKEPQGLRCVEISRSCFYINTPEISEQNCSDVNRERREVIQDKVIQPKYDIWRQEWEGYIL